MASLITELIDTLKNQNEIYKSLLDSASRKKVFIVENNIEKLQELVKQENLLVGRNQRLEKKRIELFSDIAMVLGKNVTDITLKQFIDTIKGQEGEKELIELREEMLEVLPKLKTLNDQNQELLQMSIDYVDFSMNLIRSNSAPTYYDMSGNEINATDRKMFDAKQ